MNMHISNFSVVDQFSERVNLFINKFIQKPELPSHQNSDIQRLTIAGKRVLK